MTYFSIQQPEFQLPQSLAQFLWTKSQIQYSAQIGWTAYLNRLSLAAVIPWLKDNWKTSSVITVRDWEQATGSAIQIPRSQISLRRSDGSKWLVIIPSLALERREFRVPQCWVDSPNQLGDYYLAVQVDPNRLTVCLWAFTTHINLKTQGIYSEMDGTYGLCARDLIQDLSILKATQQLFPGAPTRAMV
jgi:hypothetical protein